MNSHHSSSLCDKLPIWHFDNDLMVFKDGSLGAGFEITGKDIATATNDIINQFTRELENLLKSMTEGFKFQIFHNISKDVLETIKKHENLSTNHTGTYKEVIKARVNFLKENALAGNYYQPRIYVFIRGSKYMFKKSGLFNSKKDFEQIEEKNYLEHKESFLRTLDIVKSYLDSTELVPKELTKGQWSNLVFEYFNFSRSEKIGNPAFRDEKKRFKIKL